jgi:hypothetical protein
MPVSCVTPTSDGRRQRTAGRETRGAATVVNQTPSNLRAREAVARPREPRDLVGPRLRRPPVSDTLRARTITPGSRPGGARRRVDRRLARVELLGREARHALVTNG